MYCVLPVLFIALSVTSGDTDHLNAPQASERESEVQIIDPRSPEFQNEWNSMVEATCPEMGAQQELAHVVTLRVETLAASYVMLSDVTMNLIKIHDESIELLKSPITPLEREVIEDFQNRAMQPMLERFSDELNRTALWLESAEYEQRILAEGRSGTDIAPEQIKIRCNHEFEASLHECYRMHDFILNEMEKLENESRYFIIRNAILIRLGQITPNTNN